MVPKQRQTAGRGQRRAKNRKNILSQRMPVGDPGERTQHSLYLQSPAKAMQPRDSPLQENWPHAPWPSEVGSYAHSKTARMSGVSPVVKKGSLATALPPVPALVPFRGHLGPCMPGSPALVGTLAYKTVWPTPIWLGKPLGEWSRSWLGLDSRHDRKAELGGRDERAWDQRGVDNGKGWEPSERGVGTTDGA